jgi:hypothetical protein
VLIFRAYLTDQTIDHLASTLKRGNIKDLLLFFPPNKRDPKVLDAFFREKNLSTVADWYTKKQYAIAKDAIMNELKDVVERGDDSEAVRFTSILILAQLMELAVHRSYPQSRVN